jgi:hypothetical protein
MSIIVAAVLAWALAGPVGGEEMLNQNGKRFLGWQTSTTVFKTCKDTKIPVRDGRIEKTEERCRDSVVTPPLLVGTVDKVDPKTGTITVTVDKLLKEWNIPSTAAPRSGEAVLFFVPKTVDIQKGDSKTNFFDGIRTGQKLTFQLSGQGTVQAVTLPTNGGV